MKVQAEAQTIGCLLRTAADTFDACNELGKIDWAKLIELFMQLLPLILQFFKPRDETLKV